jgi:hypothetical protein
MSDFKDELNKLISESWPYSISLIDLKAKCSKPDMDDNEFLEVVDQITVAIPPELKDQYEVYAASAKRMYELNKQNR